MPMSEDFNLEGWEPEPVKPPLESMLSHASPYREDLKARDRRAKCEDARSRRFDCPACGIPKNIDPVFSGEEWHYFGQCSHCGARWAAARYLIRKCPDCGKKVPMTSRNPEGTCKCKGDTRGEY